MNKYQRLILKMLLDSDQPITSSKIANSLGISSRTVRRNLAELKDVCPQNGAIVVVKPSVGIYIKIEDDERFKLFLKKQSKHNKMPTTPEERIDYLIQLLLYNSDYIKVNDIADSLFISASRLGIDLKIIREKLKKHDLKIVNKPNYGIKISGSERNKRICMAEQYIKQQSTIANVIPSDHNDNYNIMINTVISKVLVQENLRMSDIALKSLAIHLLIAIERMKTSNIISLSEETKKLQINKMEYKTALALKDAIENTFDITLPNSEVCYLTQHLSGKKHFEFNSDSFDMKIDEKISFLVNKILRSIFDQTRMDFYNDLDLKLNLALHMIPFVERVQNGMMIRNPIIYDIKEKYNFAYELASIGLSSVCEELNTKISEDEISFFALHFILALKRKREEINPSNILIVCNTGRASSQLLAYQIQKEFGSKINTIQIIEYHMLNHINFESYDIIFSTVPISKKLPLPIHYIDNLLSEDDFKSIGRCLEEDKPRFHLSELLSEHLFFKDIMANTKEEAIYELAMKIKKNVKLPHNFYELVLEREQFASTELSNLIAIPHPNEAITSTTFIAVGILKRPITWSKRQVQIIFLISIMPNNKQDLRDFYEGLVEFTNIEQNTLTLLQTPTYKQLLSLLEN